MKRFKIFGWHVTVSRLPYKVTFRQGKCRSRIRETIRAERLAMSGHRCEVCGAPIDNRCSLQHLLPVGTENRNAVENVRVLCPRCFQELQSKPHALGYQQLEDTTRYDTE